MKFRPFDKKIEEVFGNNNTYSIPNFQRDYSWALNNYDDFFNDLLAASKAKYDVHKKMLTIDNTEKNDYFFGTLLVIGDNSKNDIKTPYIVVDGQQRLTTMTLFIAALKEIIEALKSTYEHNYKKALIVNFIKDGNTSEVARLVNKNLYPVLPVNILDVNEHKTNGSLHEPNNSSQKWLLDSYQLILAMLDRKALAKRLSPNLRKKDDFEGISDENYITFIDRLGQQLLNSTVVIIYSEDEQSANSIYRNFNYRGIPLSQPDLIKNEIFSLLDDDTDSALSTWKSIENNVYSINETLSTFLFHYMVSKYVTGTKASLFKSFTKNVKQTKATYINFLKDININSKFYTAMVNPTEDLTLFNKENYFKCDSNPQIKRQLIFLHIIEATQVRILLLGLFHAFSNDNITSKNFRKVINVITAHQSLHVLAGSSANKLTPIYRTHAKKFRETDKSSSSLIVKQFINDLITIIPSKEEVLQKANISYNHKMTISDMNAIQKKNFFLIKQILFILAEKEQIAKSSANDAFKFIYDASLEHIIDQSNEDFENVTSLGNLILLEQSKHTNSSDKKTMYAASEITSTKKFAADVEKFFTSGNIATRNKELLSEYYEYVANIK